MGGINANFENLKKSYPSIDFARIKQIHSDAIVETENCVLDYQQIADAHYSKSASVGLCVSTADCMPVFLIHPSSNLIAGIHAGWRGIANRIIPKTIARLHAMGAPNHEIQIIIGPHIQKPSFEVGFDVRDLILSSIGHAAVASNDIFFENTTLNKSLVDLNQVAKEQLLQEGITQDNVFDLHIDTFRNPLFHSHRRDKENAGRQLSFISRNNAN
jgi:YfiH family protein